MLTPAQALLNGRPEVDDEITVLDLKTRTRGEIAKLAHVHTPDGRCFKRRAAMLCDWPKRGEG